MRIREYTDADMAQVEKLYSESKFDYQLPDLNTFFSKRVVDDGKVGMAAMQRLCSEVYLVCDPSWRTPAWRNEAIRQLHVISNNDARKAGVQEALTFLPPEIEYRFGRRLQRDYGWLRCRPDWHCFYREIREPS